jgi:drug/metabolite transporter (DMT)-like permease
VAVPSPAAEPAPRTRRARLRPGTALAPLAAAAITLVLWASAFVGIRSAGTSLSPGALALGRLLIGSAVLGLLLALRRERLPGRESLRGGIWAALLVCGTLWFGAYNVLLNAGERDVDAGTAAMLVGVGPVIVAVLAGLLLGEGFPGALVGGLVVAFAGVAVIGLAIGGDAGSSGSGVVLCLLAAAAYAGGVVAQKPVLSRLSALQVTFVCCAIGAAVCLPFAPALADEIGRVDAGALAWMVYLGVFPTAVAFWTWAFAVSHTTVGGLAATTYLVPPLSILMGWALLGEAPPALALAGGALCLAGVLVARGATSRRRA